MADEMASTSTNGTASSQNQSPERLQEAAGGILDQAGRTAQSQASRTMDQAGETLGQVARAVRDSGNQLREDRPEIAGLVDTAAERVEQASTYLREHDAREVLGEAERFARRQPALVVGGGLVLGLILGRVLRSGAEPQNGARSGQPAQLSAGSSSSRPTTSSSPTRPNDTGNGATSDAHPEGTTAANLEATDEAVDDAIDAGSAAWGGVTSSMATSGSVRTTKSTESTTPGISGSKTATAKGRTRSSGGN